MDFINLEEIVSHALSSQLTHLHNKNVFVIQGTRPKVHNALQFAQQSLNGMVQNVLALLVSTSFRIHVFLVIPTAYIVSQLKPVSAKMDTSALLVFVLLVIAVVPLVLELDP